MLRAPMEEIILFISLEKILGLQCPGINQVTWNDVERGGVLKGVCGSSQSRSDFLYATRHHSA